MLRLKTVSVIVHVVVIHRLTINLPTQPLALARLYALELLLPRNGEQLLAALPVLVLQVVDAVHEVQYVYVLARARVLVRYAVDDDLVGLIARVFDAHDRPQNSLRLLACLDACVQVDKLLASLAGGVIINDSPLI